MIFNTVCEAVNEVSRLADKAQKQFGYSREEALHIAINTVSKTSNIDVNELHNFVEQ